MQLIHNISEFPTPLKPSVVQWTAAIPAAGRGSRLHSSGPKILYPVLGKPILTWLLDLLSPLCRDFVVVASPEGAPLIKPFLGPYADRTRFVVQDSPTGMGDAIALCENAVKTPYTLVIWGDQITPRPRTLAACMNLLESSSSIHAVIPTMTRESPYIHFRRDAKDHIIDVFQARESEQRIPRGESDCGVFCFRSEALFQVLRQTRGDPTHRGTQTMENNFLSLLPLFHSPRGQLVTLRLEDPDETLGVNTASDAKAVGLILKKRDYERNR